MKPIIEQNWILQQKINLHYFYFQKNIIPLDQILPIDRR